MGRGGGPEVVWGMGEGGRMGCEDTQPIVFSFWVFCVGWVVVGIDSGYPSGRSDVARRERDANEDCGKMEMKCRVEMWGGPANR